MSEQVSIEALAARVDSNARAITQLTDTLERSHRALSDDIKQLGIRQADSHKTPWSTLAAWAGVILSVGGLVFAGLTWNLSRIEGSLNHLRDSYVDHIRNGHPENVQDGVDRNSLRIEELDDVLQREMRLLDSSQDKRIEHLDQRLQQEMRALNATQDVQLMDIKRRLGVIEGWQVDHDKRVVGLNATQTARIEALEQVLHGEERR